VLALVVRVVYRWNREDRVRFQRNLYDNSGTNASWTVDNDNTGVIEHECQHYSMKINISKRLQKHKRPTFWKEGCAPGYIDSWIFIQRYCVTNRKDIVELGWLGFGAYMVVVPGML